MNEVKHDETNHEFYIETTEGKALLHYERENDTLNFHRTFVPRELRGKGMAEEVVTAGFQYAEENDLKVIPSCTFSEKNVKFFPKSTRAKSAQCPYVARLVMKNPKWKELTVQS